MTGRTQAPRYWFSIKCGPKILGGGFLLTPTFAVTARHCLTGALESTPEGEVLSADVSVDLGEGFGATAVKLVETCGDLALLEIMHPHRLRLVSPRGATARTGGAWEAPYKPSNQHPALSGLVDVPATEYVCRDGMKISALQLTARQNIGEHHGYSGGPVESMDGGRAGETDVFGILLEQFPDRQVPRRSSNVLFAATLSFVVCNAFRTFSYSTLMQGLRRDDGSLPTSQSPANPTSTAVETERQRLDIVRMRLEKAHAFARDGLITASELTVIRARLAEAILPGFSPLDEGSEADGHR